MMVVVALIAIMAGLTFPSVTSGLDSVRLRSSSDSILALINTAADRASRRQQAIEIVFSPAENNITARSADLGFVRHLDLTGGVHITSIRMPGPVPPAPPNAARQILLYPGGTVPAIAIEIASAGGHRRTIAIDPITGVPRSEIAR